MMVSSKHQITREDILPLDQYRRVRDQRRQQVAAFKRPRRIAVGPDVTFYFEAYDTMLHQVHEMLYIEKGGEEQIVDELRAYNPLIPQGSELVATMMIEIDEPIRRGRTLAGLGGIEQTISMIVGGDPIAAVAETDTERTTPDGKTSSIHFLRFPFTAEQVARFRDSSARVLLAITHPNYDHIAAIPEETRKALAADFD